MKTFSPYLTRGVNLPLSNSEMIKSDVQLKEEFVQIKIPSLFSIIPPM